ncbi:hypothetical protein PV721_40950 [Streptomyces sp. MB09-01]|uniref:hypothetical protein n=1 Tax=Streptomyces sp. MB09-01 TaxID=3028666 RepID=UPI0029B072BB|nr:hypothetical protein [Streptomyces sp. MB09-01]MDX3540559.1 hypothetical protein [Streptomyces sp. MB09-01]
MRIDGHADGHAHLWTAEHLARPGRLGKADTGTRRGTGAEATGADAHGGRSGPPVRADGPGMDFQVLSVAPQSPAPGGEPDAVALARAANDSYAELVVRFP